VASVSETAQSYAQALLELFNEAVKSYNNIVYWTSLIGSWDVESTVKELTLRVIRTHDNIFNEAERIARVYVVSSAVAGKRPDKRKARRLLSAAKKLERIAERVKVMAPPVEKAKGWGDYDYERKLAEALAKELVSRGDRSAKTFSDRVRAVFREINELSHELLEEAANNLVTIGIMPRKRVIEEFEEGLGDLAANEGELSEPIDNDKAREGD
jgi:phosphate uptake regulator